MGVNKLYTYALSIILFIAAASLLYTQEMQALPLMGSASAQNTSEGTELTIYSQNIALVRESITMDLQEGINVVNVTGVASRIDPGSVILEDPEQNGTYIIEQQFSTDNATVTRLLQNNLGREITVTDEAGNSYTGILLSHENDRIVIDSSGNIITFMDPSRIEFETSGDILAGPALTWQIYSPEAGSRTLLMSYLTEDINWEANYIVKLTDNESQASIDGWATIDNQAGTSFNDARIKLIAGDVRRVSGGVDPEYATDQAVSEQAPEQFSEESLFEYHIYTLNRSTNLRDGETKQISLLSERDVPVEREYLFESSMSDSIKVMMSTENTEPNGLGIPLPGGIVSTYAEDSDGMLQFVGEDEIRHTAIGQEVRMFVGYAFDITGEKTQTDYQSLGESAERRSYSINLTNQKPEDVNVTVVENIYGDWEITNSSHNYTKVDAFTAEFDVGVPADGEETLTYTVEVRYQQATPY